MSVIVEVPPYGSAEWLAGRRGGLGASEMAVVTGDDPWRSEWDLVAQKRGDAEAVAESWPMRMGHIMEPVGLDWYDESHGCTLSRGETWSDPRWPHVYATLDGRHGTTGVEVKWTNGWRAVPRHVRIQAYTQIGVADLERVDIVRLSSRDAPEVVETIERDDEVVVPLLDLAEAWWARYIEGDELPPLDGSRAAMRHLDKLRGDDEAEATAEQSALMGALRLVRRRLSETEGEERAIVAALKASMAGTGVLRGDGFRVVWSAVKGKTLIDWRSIAAEHRNELVMFAQALQGDETARALIESLDAVEIKYTTVGEPSTSFRPTWEDTDE